MDRIDVLGVGISVTTMSEALDCLEWQLERRKQGYVCVTGVHGVMESRRDGELQTIHNKSVLTVPDGRPMVWCGHFVGARSMRQVRGVDLTLRLCALAETRGWASYFYGGAEGTPELLVERLRERFPRLRVAGTFSPPFRPLTSQEDADSIKRINDSGADIVWVGLSTPKQERWMADHVGKLKAPLMIGVGAAFDVHAGLSRPAPRWVGPLGLEWLYRLIREPRRLWRRYLINNPKFLVSILRRPPRLR